MKKFVDADIEMLSLESTAFGPNDPTSVDSAKAPVNDDAGNLLGWKEQYGQS